jgi:hypothetical protein
MMQHRRTLFQAIAALFTIWIVVYAVRSYAGSRKITAERIQQEISRANLDDWSQGGENNASLARQREEKIRKIADLTNRLDFQEREKNRKNRSNETFFRLLNAKERNLFIDLTVVESMNRFMQALDQMPAAERKRFVKQGLEEIAKGKTAEEMARTRELGDDVMAKIAQEGIRAYFEKASTDTKLDLAPLMESMNEVMQGLRGNRFGPPRN